MRFVRECLHAEPDPWQHDVLKLMAVPGRKRIAMKACAGPGKTAVLAWRRMASSGVLCGS